MHRRIAIIQILCSGQSKVRELQNKATLTYRLFISFLRRRLVQGSSGWMDGRMNLQVRKTGEHH